jgi:DNA-binding Lrp family transcriptional regulator
VKLGDYARYDVEAGWNWDWCQWEEQIRKNIRYKRKIQPPLNPTPTIMDFDVNDVTLLRNLFDDGELTKKKLAQILSLSEAQVKKRLLRFEKEGVIKGYRSPFRGQEESMNMFCFFEVDSPKNPVLTSIYELPFPATIVLESPTRYAMTMSLCTRDLKGFLKGFDILRPHLISFFIQTMHDSKQSMDSHPYNLFDEETNDWITPGDEYVQDVQKVLATKSTKNEKKKITK